MLGGQGVVVGGRGLKVEGGMIRHNMCGAGWVRLCGAAHHDSIGNKAEIRAHDPQLSTKG